MQYMDHATAVGIDWGNGFPPPGGFEFCACMLPSISLDGMEYQTWYSLAWSSGPLHSVTPLLGIFLFFKGAAMTGQTGEDTSSLYPSVCFSFVAP